ncbi:MAG: 2-oxoglutarate dehydrogenase E1 component [Luteibaculaceae bacterium]
MDKFSYLSNTNPETIDNLYQEYRNNPESVENGWRKFFEGFEFAKIDYSSNGSAGKIPENIQKEFKVINLIQAYRQRGHLFTKTNPVRERRKYSPTLDIENFGLEAKDLETTFQCGSECGMGAAKLKDIIDHLQKCYCESIGIEFTYIRQPEKREWLIKKVEELEQKRYSAEEKKAIFKDLKKASVFEQFLQKKFVGQKRFSVEGGEALMPALNALIAKGTALGVQEFVVGMAHRGRLNVLANIFRKKPEQIFSEFEGKAYGEEDLFDGDVKYHMGYTNNFTLDNKKEVKLTLCPNPSHLEAVDPVVQGLSRAKIDTYLKDNKKLIPVMIHGDAAIAAQGVVYEVIQMAGLKGYNVGGTVHVVINNQVGFTTNYIDARTSTYCTDIAKTTLSPVFHVNGDDVEAVVKTFELATEYRQTYGMDVFIDLLCYRKYGHNEGDEPKFTQPNLYKIIASHPNPSEIYFNELKEQGVLTDEENEALNKAMDDELSEKFDIAKGLDKTPFNNFLQEEWKHLADAKKGEVLSPVKTEFKLEELQKLAVKLNTLPEGKNYFRKIEKLMKDRLKMIEEDRLDWACGELLAYATLLTEGHQVRISGQDVERGTFSHRHAVVKTEDTEEEIIPLNLLQEKQERLRIYNSLLSEYAVLGFEYGYAYGTPNGLTIWEAQFGDFNNGAQIMIDQFISAGEDKWKAQNGVVMLLPHGYEGQGSEHSSARVERFLQLCAEDNMIIANATTPANYFHLLRRQVKFNFRKPLVVFTPKMLLRYPSCTSTLEELANGSFQEVIDDPNANKDKVDTVVLCSGKAYYEASEKAVELGKENYAFVRLEQLYPLPVEKIDAILDSYKKAKRFIWFQEEPENMGAYGFMLRKYKTRNLEPITQRESASPAPGSSEVHKLRYKKLYERLFA